MSEQNTLTARIENKIDKGTTSALSLGKNGSLAYANLAEIMEVAKVVAISQVAIPQHLRDNVGACLAICIQSSEWQMSPFSVANKSYVVNNRLAYEAQLVNAVILRRAPITGRFKISYSGDGPTRKCKVGVKLNADEGGELVEYESPMVKDIPVKNSPLWKGDPDQQLFYYSSRAMCRRHFPDVLLGIYTVDEMAELTHPEKDITPNVPRFDDAPPALPPGKPATEAAPEVVEQPPVTASAPEESAVGTSETPDEPGGDNTPAPVDTDKEALIADLKARMDKDGVSAKTVKTWAVANAGVATTAILTKDYTIEQLQALDERWNEIAGN